MFQKSIILLFLILTTLFISIQSKEENSHKFLSKTQKSTPDLISFEEEAKVINIKCLFSKNYNFYSLQSLQNKEKDYEYKQPNSSYTFFYNFCQNTKTVDTSTIVRKNEDGKMVKLAGSIDGEGEDKNQWMEMGDSEKKEGISISLTKGDTCLENPESKYSTSIIVHCDSEVDEIGDLKIIQGNFPCVYTMEFKSRYGCPLGSSYLLIKLLEDYKYIFMVVMLILGIFLCFFGLRYISPTIIVLCGIVGCYLLTALILSLFPDFISSETWLFVCLLVCCILGCIIGYFTKDQVNFYVILCGAFLGYSVATFFYQIVQTYVSWDPQILFYVCIGICVVAGGAIGYFLTDTILILSLSVFGGYLVMRAVSLVAGNYLDEGMTIDLIKNQEWEQLKELRSSWIYAYLGTWLALAIAGTIVQCKYHKEQKQKQQGISTKKMKNEKKK